MNFGSFKTYLQFTKYQRTGIFLLFIIIVGLQLFYLFSDFNVSEQANPEKEQWLSLQSEIDNEKAATENRKPVVFFF